jgi:Peptidase family M23/Putative peptidoglycan binding domain
VVDGIAGPKTRRALGRRGRPRLGSRVMRRGHRGWDVAALQFMLRRRGFSPRGIDGGFGRNTRRAVIRFQRARRLVADGLAGPATIRSLKRRRARRRRGGGGPVRFFRPVRAPMGDGFGWRYGRRHTGIDFPAPYGRRVGAAGRGVTSFAGWNSGGYGYLVVIRHRRGFSTWYAHLSRITTWRGERVVGGTRIGYVGSTGRSTGPHLHFEVRRRGVPINPRPRLLSRAAGAAGLSRSPIRRLECADDVDRGRPADLRLTTSWPALEPLAPCRD